MMVVLVKDHRQLPQISLYAASQKNFMAPARRFVSPKAPLAYLPVAAFRFWAVSLDMEECNVLAHTSIVCGRLAVAGYKHSSLS